MKLTIKDLNNAMQSGALLRLIGDRNLSLATKFKLKTIWKQCLEHWKTFETERNELCSEYGTATTIKRDAPDGTTTELTQWDFGTEETQKTVLKHLTELENVQIEILGDPLTPKDLTKPIDKPEVLSTEDLCLLEWLFVDSSDASDTAPAPPPPPDTAAAAS